MDAVTRFVDRVLAMGRERPKTAAALALAFVLAVWGTILLASGPGDDRSYRVAWGEDTPDVGGVISLGFGLLKWIGKWLLYGIVAGLAWRFLRVKPQPPGEPVPVAEAKAAPTLGAEERIKELERQLESLRTKPAPVQTTGTWNATPEGLAWDRVSDEALANVEREAKPATVDPHWSASWVRQPASDAVAETISITPPQEPADDRLARMEASIVALSAAVLSPAKPARKRPAKKAATKGAK